jgi:hypothetical protein
MLRGYFMTPDVAFLVVSLWNHEPGERRRAAVEGSSWAPDPSDPKRAIVHLVDERGEPIRDVTVRRFSGGAVGTSDLSDVTISVIDDDGTICMLFQYEGDRVVATLKHGQSASALRSQREFRDLTDAQVRSLDGEIMVLLSKP